MGQRKFPIKASTRRMAYQKILEKQLDFGHTSGNNFWEKICFIISKKKGPNHPPNIIKWISIELGGDYLIKYG